MVWPYPNRCVFTTFPISAPTIEAVYLSRGNMGMGLAVILT
jgi:hypothetical protein